MRETPAALRAFNDYVAMGPERSIIGLVARYRAAHEPSPSRRVATVAEWSRSHLWQNRLKAIEDQEAAALATEHLRKRAEVMEASFALDYERVRLLVGIVRRLGAAFLRLTQTWETVTPSQDQIEQAAKLVQSIETANKGIAAEKGERIRTVNVKSDTIAWARDYARGLGVREEDAQRIAEEVLRGL